MYFLRSSSKMKRFFTTKKAQGLTQRFFSSQRYHHHHEAGSHSVLQAPDFSTRSKSFRLSSSGFTGNLPTTSSYHSRSYATSTIQNSNGELQFRHNREEEDENKQVDLQIISRESIKPASPTPDHLRIFNFSIFDKLFFHCYTPSLLFFPNMDHASIADVITKRTKHLKDSLSEVLTQYYPLAGEIKDDLHIECNDKGVHFVLAQVNQSLNDFLRQPDDQKVRELIPKHPSETKSSSPNYVASLQVNVFSCGGIALSRKTSHKIIDGFTFLTFMNAWANTAKGLPEKITPSFVASDIFPSNRPLKYSLPSKFMSSKPFATKRFVFDSTSLSSLKKQLAATTGHSSSPMELPLRGPSRMEAVGAVIWKAAAKAASTIRPFNPRSPHAFLTLVNIRQRALPCLPIETVGNLFLSAVAICFPHSQPDLHILFRQTKESIDKINPEWIEAYKGENGYQIIDSQLKRLNDIYDSMDEGDNLIATSMLNNGLFQIDFGWGKPIWSYHVNPGFSRMVSMLDMAKGGGVEAIVTLSPQEMKIFECDPEILTYTTVDPSPLQFLY